MSAGFCSSCGTPATPGHKFCKKCGGALLAQPVGNQAPVRIPVRSAGTARPQLSIDTGNLPVAEMIIAVSALVTMILSLMKSWRVEYYGVYHVWPQWITFVFSLLIMLFAIGMIADRYLHFLPEFKTGPIYLAAAIGILIFTILPTFIKPPNADSSMGYYYYTSHFVWGLFIAALLFGISVLIGALIKMQQER